MAAMADQYSLPTQSHTSDATESQIKDPTASSCDQQKDGSHIWKPRMPSTRSRLLRRISGRILELDHGKGDVSSTEGDKDESCISNILSYLHENVSAETRANIAKYLASHNFEHCKLNMEDIHHYYHVASCLNLKQLKDHCLKFCFHQNQIEILEKFEGCGCLAEIKRESKAGYQRSQSVVSNSDENEPPQYYIVFSNNTEGKASEAKVTKRKNSVMVIDVSEKHNVYHKEVDKLQQFGEGFSCCSCEIGESPYVFISGGKGKSNQMWMYDVLLSRWSKCAKMIHGRSNHMMVSVGETSVVVLGGQETSCIEEYSIKRSKWRERAALITNVTSSAVIALQGKIYVFGGETPAGPVSTAQCYDVTKHVIDRLPYLPCQFSGGRCVAFKDRVFIATDQGHMICFNPLTGYASLCTQQPVLRRQFGMFVNKERIYLVGGILQIPNSDDEKRQTPQYRYNTEKDLWVEKYKLCENFPVLASCVIHYPRKCSIVPFNETF